VKWKTHYFLYTIPGTAKLLIINYKIDIFSVDNYGTTPLHILYSNKNHLEENLFEYLINQGLNVNRQNFKGDTPLTKLGCNGKIKKCIYQY